MTYEELNMKYQALLSEVVHLRKENSELKKRLGIPNPEETTGDAERAADQVSPSTVNNEKALSFIRFVEAKEIR